MELFLTGEEKINDSRLASIIGARACPGMIYAGSNVPEERFECALGIPQVKIGFSIVHPVCHSVCHDSFGMTLALCQILLERGYRRIGFAYDPVATSRTRHRTTGAFLAFRDGAAGRLTVPPLRCGPDGRDEFRAWLKKNRPDVVVGAGGYFHRWLVEDGWKLPGDIGYAATYWRRGEPEFSGIAHDYAAQGSAATSSLVAQIMRNESDSPAVPVHLSIPGLWQEGGSLRPSITTGGVPQLNLVKRSMVEAIIPTV